MSPLLWINVPNEGVDRLLFSGLSLLPEAGSLWGFFVGVVSVRPLSGDFFADSLAVRMVQLSLYPRVSIRVRLSPIPGS
jgi:hypothetical protein